MSDGLEVIQRTLESEAADVPERTRRQFVGRAAVAVGGLGLAGVLPGAALASNGQPDTQTILNVAASAEVSQRSSTPSAGAVGSAATA